ncbi:MAG: nucleotidyltransferase domain-containing protein [Spirochaetaceae bacterium]|nr:MAG: nucleotidyltransferase domain-containing protein [Spirochaetaceae bacterium]
MTPATEAVCNHALHVFGENVLAVLLIGSYARGTFNENSDLDVLIILESSNESPRDRAMHYGEPDGYTGPEISPVIYTLDEFRRMPSFVLSLLDGSETLYSRELPDGTRADKDCLRRVEAYVADNGIERVRHKGGYYWRGLPTAPARRQTTPDRP